MDGLSAVNCVNVFLCTIATTNDFESLEDVTYSIKELLDWADYTIDNEGNWYDEDGKRFCQKITLDIDNKMWYNQDVS